MWWTLLIAAIACLGHLGLWVTIFNQLHATAIPRPAKKISEKIIYLCTGGIGLVLGARYLALIPVGPDFLKFFENPVVRGYSTVCLVLGAYFLLRWAFRKVTFREPSRCKLTTSQVEDFTVQTKQSLAGDAIGKVCASIPMNQIFQVDLNEKEYTFANLPEQFDGYTIAHVSDLHFTGHISQAFFEIAVEKINQMKPDLIAITGDIIDKKKCFPWIGETLSKLQAKDGVYWVLGNHDKRIKDVDALRSELDQLGFVGVNGCWKGVERDGAQLVFFGNELPWFPGAEQFNRLEDTVPTDAFRVLLSHSPDQFFWGAVRNFDLILAGHTHGGQIRPPLIGPIIAPSRYGVRFASGNFEFIKTLMHVSRGISGVHPIRFNCPPELTLLRLRRA